MHAESILSGEVFEKMSKPPVGVANMCWKDIHWICDVTQIIPAGVSNI